MNKKLIVGTAALTTVVVGGYLYYRWVRSRALDLFLDDEPEPLRMEDFSKRDWERIQESIATLQAPGEDEVFHLEVHPRTMSPEQRRAHVE